MPMPAPTARNANVGTARAWPRHRSPSAAQLTLLSSTTGASTAVSSGVRRSNGPSSPRLCAKDMVRPSAWMTPGAETPTRRSGPSSAAGLANGGADHLGRVPGDVARPGRAGLLAVLRDDRAGQVGHRDPQVVAADVDGDDVAGGRRQPVVGRHPAELPAPDPGLGDDAGGQQAAHRFGDGRPRQAGAVGQLRPGQRDAFEQGGEHRAVGGLAAVHRHPSSSTARRVTTVGLDACRWHRVQVFIKQPT